MQIDINLIKIKPNRQRKDLGDLSELKGSLLQVGLINPIVVEPAEDPGYFYLLAGERRFTSWKELQSEGKVPLEIEARLFSQLDEPTRQLVELEENVRRKDLTWQEQISAVAKLYELKGFTSAEQASPYFNLAPATINRMLQVFHALDLPRVAEAHTYSQAYSILTRENARTLDNMSMELNNFFKEITNEPSTEEPGIPGEIQSSVGEPIQAELPLKPARESQYRILQADFLEWAKSYNGKPFDLLHLDFPYGINHDRSEQGNTVSYGAYEDSEDIYKTLVRTLLENQDHIVAEKAHAICWLSFRFFEWTKKAFEEAGWTALLQPLIWHKSDNKGIIADVKCGFRNVGEYALLLVRGRKNVVKNISNIYSGPTTKRFHVSEKPLPMLKHFFSGLCDHYSRVLDPTCGSGTAIMAAQYYNAEEALGLELSPEFAGKAQEWLRNYLAESGDANIDLELSMEDFEL